MAAKVSSRITVLGGGISGLSAAHFLAKKHADPSKITVVEARPRVGGWMHSVRSESGAVFEQGPRSMRSAGPAGAATLKLASDLNLENQIIPISTSHAGAQNRFIYAKGKLHKLPNSISSILKKQSLFSKSLLPVILKEPFVKKKSDDTDESVYDFLSRRLSKDVAEYVGDPLCRGIFAGDARLLSLKSALPSVHSMEKTHGSVIKATVFAGKAGTPDPHPLVQKATKENWSVWTLQGGLQTMVNKLHKSLEQMGVQVRMETPCNSIEFQQDGSVVLQTGEDSLKSDHLISTLSAGRLSPLLPYSHAELRNELNTIPSVSVGLVNLEYKSNIVKDEGFGVLVPSSEHVKVLGIIYDSCVFPQHEGNDKDHCRLTIMMGGQWFEEHCGHPDTVTPDTLKDIAVEEVGKILGITEEPVHYLAKVQRNCISQYTIGHSDRVKRIFDYVQEKKLPISLIGASFKGVSVNDCVYNAQREVEEMVGQL